MTQSAVIHARIDPATKEATERVLAELGLTPTEAIRLFYRQIALRGEFPLELRVANPLTVETLLRADQGKDLEEFASTAELYESWDS
jgi:DNA-damage-inducible protein J